MSADGGLTNTLSVHAAVYVCMHVEDAGGPSCNQITTSPSSLPSSTTSGASLRTHQRAALRAATAVQHRRRGQLKCVCVLNNSRGFSLSHKEVRTHGNAEHQEYK